MNYLWKLQSKLPSEQYNAHGSDGVYLVYYRGPKLDKNECIAAVFDEQSAIEAAALHATRIFLYA